MATNWVTITSADVESYLIAAPALQAAALSGTDSALATIIPDVVNELRGTIASHNYNISATAATLPPELRLTGIYLCIAALQSRANGETPAQLQKQIDKAENVLQMLREGKFAITAPTDPAANGYEENTPAPSTSPRTLSFDSASQDGI